MIIEITTKRSGVLVRRGRHFHCAAVVMREVHGAWPDRLMQGSYFRWEFKPRRRRAA